MDSNEQLTFRYIYPFHPLTNSGMNFPTQSCPQAHLAGLGALPTTL
jgi:hypothetical protein